MTQELRISSPWIVQPRPNPNATLRLFCFPYAGGTPHVFRTWPEGLPSFVDVCGVQLPGRGTRLREQSYTRIKALVPDAAAALSSFMDRPFAFFGHSMGAFVGFELARVLRDSGARQPEILFFSGARAPQLRRRDTKTYNLPDDEFIEELRRLNGTPAEVLEHPELLQLVMPLVRTDFEMTDTYEYVDGPPLKCPLIVFGGMEDSEVGRERLEPWSQQTTGPFTLIMLPGDHFFLHSQQRVMLTRISRDLQGL
jgi:medium-chain acyl-[acyl-carrier-protein] hydrolase